MTVEDHLKAFASIAARAQRLANEHGGDYSGLTFDQLCEFMTEIDNALTRAEDDGVVRIP